MIWKRKQCNFCGYNLKNDWSFCPNCGRPVREFGIFERMFNEIETEFQRIDKEFKKPRIKTSGGEIHITVQSGTGMEPRIEVRTSGDYKNLEPEIKRKLGLSESIKNTFRKPKKTEEPETKMSKNKDKTIITINLPDIKSEDQIEIKQFEQSIEVKAFAKDKTYFKLIPIPANSVVNKTFRNGVLEIEIKNKAI
ncbi:MAG: zinc ribbon domain-containing protein [Candidatus Aenigmatarchaeota archaeon]|nr:zinc ribbon domain-containing protein [Candidatus Aenigmarchaeota archaeon]